MAAEQLSLTDNARSTFINNRLLGTIGIIGGPMLLMEALIFGLAVGSPSPAHRLLGVLELLYIGGWMCSAVGMRRARVTGNNWPSTAIFVVQMTGLLLAALFSAQGIVQPNPDANSLFFSVTDAAWPLSHLLMLAVSFLVWRAGVWRGWRKVAPLVCGLALPVFFAANAAGAKEVGLILFPALSAIGFIALGYAVSTTRQTTASA